MTLSQETIRALENFGYTSDKDRKFFESIWRSEGESFFWGFLNKEQESRDLCAQWAPRLRQYAKDCRIARPLPTLQSLSVAQRAQYDILHEKMGAFQRKQTIQARKTGHVAILHSSSVGLLAAQDVFGPSSNTFIHLLDFENAYWFREVYQRDEAAFWWHCFYWWSITDIVDLHEFQSYIAENYTTPDGFTYWVVTGGEQWGDLAGGADHELWKWDGEKAEPIELFCDDTY